MGVGTPQGNLPPLPKPPCKMMRGPTAWSNWVIKGHVLVGAYPATIDDRETEEILTTLLETGIDTFVCLQAEVSLNVSEARWRSGYALRPYIHDAQRILSRAHQSGNARIPQTRLDFLHLPVVDGSVTTDEAIMRLRDDCCERILRGERLYIHCWGGHGRTGTLVCLILGKLYGLPSATALHLCQCYHDTRRFPQNVRSPQTPVQRAQVQRILGRSESAENRLRQLSAPQHVPASPQRAAASPAARGGSGAALSRADSSRAPPPIGSLSSRAARQKSGADSVVGRMQALALSGSPAAHPREGYVPRQSRKPSRDAAPDRGAAAGARGAGSSRSPSSRRTLLA